MTRGHGASELHSRAVLRGLAHILLFVLALSCAASARAAEKPKVRALTAFVRLERAPYKEQIAEALAMLRKAKEAYEQAGYEVQSIRISTQPFPEYTRGLGGDAVVAFFREYEALAKKEGFDTAIGPAMLRDTDDPRQVELLGEILRHTTTLNASVVVAGEDGVHWNAVLAAAKLMKFLSKKTRHSQGNFSFSATAMVPVNTPFYPGSYHTGAGRQFGIALQSANVVAEAFASSRQPGTAGKALESALGQHARVIEAVALRLEKETAWSYVGIDLSPAPLKDVSIGAAIENLTGAKVGSSGTMTAAAVITAALRAIPVKRAGYSGLMLPVLEDSVLAQRWGEGTLTLDSLLAYSAVCGTGLDTIPLPGDVTEEQLARIIGDVASLAFKLRKPLSARLQPVAGKKAGERSAFDDPFLVNTTLRPMP
ncbi:MAG: DUF711 family protein [Acidobacteria bacterium]|nr:DUF711 family protein [Acidobacteriota bacterium]